MKMDSRILNNLEEAFNNPTSRLYQQLQSLLSKTSSDHLEYMKNNSKAIGCKIKRSIYVGDIINNNGARILDFGSGCGFLSCVLAATGAEFVTGVEIDEPRRRTAEFLAEKVFKVENVNSMHVNVVAFIYDDLTKEILQVERVKIR